MPASELFPSVLAILAVFVLAVSILIVPLLNTFISPQLKADALNDATSLSSGNGGLWLSSGGSGVMGGFEAIAFFIVVFAVIITIPFFVQKTKPDKIKPPYMGGEHVSDDIRGIEFIGPGDKRESVIVHNYYFKNLLGEKNLTLWLNILAAAIIFVMFGVVI